MVYKEFTCHEAMDPLVCFNQYESSVGLKQHRHFLDHVIFIYFRIGLPWQAKLRPDFYATR